MAEEQKARSADPASMELIEKARKEDLQTVWDRYETMKPHCRFGQQGTCCKLCNMGPCRIDGKKRLLGVCGATAETIAARNLARMIAAGTAAHSDHGRSVAQTFILAAEGKAPSYQLKDTVKLRQLAQEFDIKVEGRSDSEIGKELGEKALAEFGKQDGELVLTKRAPKKRQELWRKLGMMPRGIDREVVEMMHRTHEGVDCDYRNILLQGFRTALADGWGGSMLATDMQDILFKSPMAVRAEVNLGVLKPDEVNVLVHGHEPILSDVVVEASRDPELLALAEKNGAKGINLAGICCTANEILMRHGIPVAGNFLQQELAIMTGSVELMMVDVQCLMPALAGITGCFHTKLVTTSYKCKMPGVEHIEVHEEHALETAKDILRMAVENYKNREPGRVQIPSHKSDMVGGFTSENVSYYLGGKYRATYRPLNDAIIDGRLRGAAGIVGCNCPDIQQDYGHLAMAKEFLKNDVLVVVTGCAATAVGKGGLMRPEAAFEYAGKGLREVCEAVGIPPILHLGACVDNTRILTTLCEMVAEGGLGEDISDLPVAGAAPEWMCEKAIAIGFYFVGSGVYTLFGTPHPILGSKEVTDYVTGGVEEIVGGKFAFESDPVKAARLMIDHIDKKRKALSLKPMMYASEAEAVEATA